MTMPRHTLVRAAAAAASLAMPAVALAQAPATPWARVDSAVSAELRRTGTPGAAVALVSGDRIVYARGYGQSSPEGGGAVTPAMLFRIASVTKVFTAATLATLADSGRLDLAQPLGDRLGALPDPLRRVTPHQLLSHTAGLTMGPVPPGGGDPASALTTAVGALSPRIAFAAPGEIFSYSNVGYVLAGRAAEVAGGRPYAQLVRDVVLAPLGMTTSTFDSATAIAAPQGVARGLLAPGPGAGPAPDAGPAGWPFAGLYSSANDLARFAIAFMNAGRIDGRQALSPAAIARIATPVAPFVSGEGDYGYGVRLYRHRGIDVVEHGGIGQDGFRSLLYMAPARRVAVIVLANRAGPRPYAIADAALDALLPGVVEPVVPVPAVVPMTAEEMARYVGHYEQGATTIDASVDDGVLVLHQGSAALPVRKLADERLVAGPPQGGNWLAFVTGPDGAVRYLHLNMRAYRRR